VNSSFFQKVVVVDQKKKNSINTTTTTELVLPEELFSVEDVMKELHAAGKGYGQNHIVKPLSIDLSFFVKAFNTIQTRIIFYVDTKNLP
jgi:hypothetical protein